MLPTMHNPGVWIKMKILLLLLAINLSLLANEPILQPITSEPEKKVFTDKQLNRIAKGKSVFREFSMTSGKHYEVTFTVQAPPAKVWQVLKDFKSIPHWIDTVKKATVYKQQDTLTHVAFTSKNWLLGDIKWFVIHNYPNNEVQRNWGSWTLDYEKQSFFKDSIGYWKVTTDLANPNRTQVTYSIQMILSNNIPKLLHARIIKTGIKDTIQWVIGATQANKVEKAG